jgi:hypothetical protein
MTASSCFGDVAGEEGEFVERGLTGPGRSSTLALRDGKGVGGASLSVVGGVVEVEARRTEIWRAYVWHGSLDICTGAPWKRRDDARRGVTVL